MNYNDFFNDFNVVNYIRDIIIILRKHETYEKQLFFILLWPDMEVIHPDAIAIECSA